MPQNDSLVEQSRPVQPDAGPQQNAQLAPGHAYYETERSGKKDYLQVDRQKNSNFPPHYHYCHELIYVTRGHIRMTVNDLIQDLGPGDVGFALSNDIHSYSTDGSSRAFLLLCSPDLITSYLPAKTCASYKYAVPFLHDDTGELLRCFEALETLDNQKLHAELEEGRLNAYTHMPFTGTTRSPEEVTYEPPAKAAPDDVNDVFAPTEPGNADAASAPSTDNGADDNAPPATLSPTAPAGAGPIPDTVPDGSDITAAPFAPDGPGGLSIPAAFSDTATLSAHTAPDRAFADREPVQSPRTVARDTREDFVLRKGYLYLLFGMAGRKLQLVEKTDRGALQTSDIQVILQYIQENFTRRIRLEDIAQQAGLSPCHVSRVFKRTVGCALTDYINHLRINLAQQLLRESDLSVISIAIDCGFESQRHFNRVFRTYCGLTPSAYRQADAPGTLADPTADAKRPAIEPVPYVEWSVPPGED